MRTAQTEQERGIVRGKVVSRKTGDPVSNAQISVEGTEVSTVTGANGEFEIELPPGEHTLAIAHLQYRKKTTTVAVSSGETLSREIAMRATGYEMEEMKVTATHLKGSIPAFMEEEKASPEVVDALSAEQMSRAGDSYVSEALRRLPGVTLVEDKFVFVRGLGERYSSVLFNGARLPSTDPTRRVIELDLFPADVLEGAVVQKSYSPDIPASFAGGTVMLRPRTHPQEFFAKLSGEVGYRTDTTLDDGFTYEGGDTDFLGVDDDTRELPGSIPSSLAGKSPQELEAIGEDFTGIYDIDEESVPPNHTFTFSIGDQFRPGANTFGYLAAVRYKQDWQTIERDWRTFNRQGETLNDIDQTWTDRDIDTSVFLNLGAELGENHQLSSTTMLLRRTTDTARQGLGRFDDWDAVMRRTELRWVERSLINQQVSGEHAFPAFHDLDLDWQYTFGTGSREAPDRRIYLFEQEGDGFTFPLRSDNNVRLFEEMDNYNHDLSTDLSIPLPIERLQKTSFKTGFKLVDKSRESDIRRFTFEDVAPISQNLRSTGSLEDILNEENIGSNGFQVQDVTRPSDSYEADQTILAYYAMADIRINNHFGVTGGARVESSDQELESRNLFGGTIKPDLETDDVFPALSGTWFVGGSDDTKLRLAFSETINRPDFKELSPAPFIDPVTRLNVVGNPELEETSIQNLDLRFEHFFSDTENVAVSLFYKSFDQPIERIQELGPAQTSTFINSEEAENYGVELETLKYLGFLHERLSNFYLGGNLALIESEVTLDEEQKGELTNTERALQGQSDWVLNLNAGYENPDRGIVANLLFNMSGERISQLGTRGRPDIKKQPVPRLDFVYSQDLHEAWKLKFEAANLLDPDIEFEQGSNITRSHQEGRELSLELTYTFR
jgi:hypothetical protein